MGDGGENISWVEKMFQKFEDLYLEVEFALREEMRNVENQLQIIGANFLNIYRDRPVLDEPSQSSENEVMEEAVDDSSDILIPDDASGTDTNEDYSEDEDDTEKEDDASEILTDEHYEDIEEDTDDVSEILTDEGYEDTVEEADDASDIDTDDYDSEEDIEEEAYDASDIDTDDYDSEEDTEKVAYDASDIKTCKYNSEEDAEEATPYDNDIQVSSVLNTHFHEGHREITGKSKEDEMLRLRKLKTMKLLGVTVEVEIPEDEFCDSEWVIV